jgi:hypothetical protein
MEKIFVNKCFLFTVGSVCHVKRFHLGGRSFAEDEEVEMEVRSVELGGKHFADNEEVQTEFRKWLRQQSKDFNAAGFEALVKQ